MFGAAAGTFAGSVQLAWYPDPIVSETRFRGTTHSTDLRSVMRSLSRPTFWFSTAAAAFASVECLAEDLRGKKDSWNATCGGLAAGFIIGATTKRLDIATSTAFGLGLLMFATDFTGPSTIADSNQLEMQNKMFGVLPRQHKESDALFALKEKYPQHNLK
jgi:hypothetical protein